ncbi:DUF397 domain-containing protein [Saccharopolyspora halophila]|uniref:DUF397 domain-containing protein n=1 Tax=Saccharopolyspora halophila TaxID=405551 RepID=A0ABP5T4U9_9PSEU
MSLQWRKSSRSSNYGNCVEVAFAGDGVLTRDSKDPGGDRLVINTLSWASFLDGLRRGHFDRKIN